MKSLFGQKRQRAPPSGSGGSGTYHAVQATSPGGSAAAYGYAYGAGPSGAPGGGRGDGNAGGGEDERSSRTSMSRAQVPILLDGVGNSSSSSSNGANGYGAYATSYGSASGGSRFVSVRTAAASTGM